MPRRLGGIGFLCHPFQCGFALDAAIPALQSPPQLGMVRDAHPSLTGNHLSPRPPVPSDVNGAPSVSGF